jgi:hypothetical protein
MSPTRQLTKGPQSPGDNRPPGPSANDNKGGGSRPSSVFRNTSARIAPAEDLETEVLFPDLDLPVAEYVSWLKRVGLDQSSTEGTPIRLDELPEGRARDEAHFRVSSRSRHSVQAVRTNLSANAFARGDRMGVLMARAPVERSTSSNGPTNFVSSVTVKEVYSPGLVFELNHQVAGLLGDPGPNRGEPSRRPGTPRGLLYR